MKEDAEIEEQSTVIKGRGGRRTGAGRKHGSRTAKTIEIQEAAKKYAGDALKALVDVAKDSKSDSARVAAASALLDRGYGRPRQAIEHTGNVSTSGVMIVPEATDAETWAAQVQARQAALISLVPSNEEDAA